MIMKKFLFRKIDIEVMILSIICVCYLSPLVQRTIGTNGILLVIGIYLFLEINHILHTTTYIQNTLFLVLIYIGILLLYSFIGMSDKGAGQTNTILFLLSYFIIVPIYKRLTKFHCAFIITICLLTLFITMAQNYMLWVKMGYRYTQQWYKRAGIREVINTQYVSAIMFFSGVLFSMFLFYKGNRMRYLFLLLSATCFMFNVFVTQRATTLLLSLIMFLLFLLINGKITKGKVIRYVIFLFLVFMLAFEFRNFLNWVASWISSERIAKRINSINNLLAINSITETEEGSLTVRLRLMGISINTFFGSWGNFLLGVGDKTDDLLVGNHSYFFDELAKFGIFGGLLSYTINIRMLKTNIYISYVTKSNFTYKFFLPIIITVILRSLVGGIFAPSIGIALFIFTPLTFRIMKCERI